MSKRVLCLVLMVAFMLLTLSRSSSAQTTNPCLIINWEECFMGDNCTPPPPWFIVGPGPGGWTLSIGAWICAPQGSGSETCTFCVPSGGGAGPGAGAGGSGTSGNTPINQVGRPISLPIGNTFIEQSDIRAPGLGGGIALSRRWNSVWPPTQIASSIGIFGPNWRSTYEERVFMASDNYLKYSRSDGSYWSFGLGAGNNTVLVAPANSSASFVVGTSNWTITFLTGEKRQFNPTTGLLTAIIDRNGNATQLTYDSSNRLVTVTDSSSRHLYFNYASGSSLLVTSVTSDFGITLSYAYDAQGRLSQVTKPDLTTISFTYNAQSLITAVTDSNGKVLESHTYDSNSRGLTSSRANGVEALTVTYP